MSRGKLQVSGRPNRVVTDQLDINIGEINKMRINLKM